MPVDPQSQKHDQDDEYECVGLVQPVAHVFPVLAQLHSCPRQQVTPWQRADERENAELREVHARDACGQGDERSYDRHHASPEHGRLSVARKPSVRKVDIVMPDKDILAVFLDKGPASPCANPIGNDRAEQVGRGAVERKSMNVKLAAGDRLPGERHDRFAGNGDACALKSHPQEYAAVSKHADNLSDEIDKAFYNAMMFQAIFSDAVLISVYSIIMI